jgi:hypothetical protein
MESIGYLHSGELLVARFHRSAYNIPFVQRSSSAGLVRGAIFAMVAAFWLAAAALRYGAGTRTRPVGRPVLY